MRSLQHPPASPRGRRWSAFHALAVLVLVGLVLGGAAFARAADSRYTIAFANLAEDPGARLEGTGFTGADVRQSFELAARRLPLDVVFYDNANDARKALANAEDAVARKVDLYVQYFHDAAVNASLAERLRAARIPAIAIITPMPGAPLVTIDNRAAGRVAGDALGEFGAQGWRGQRMVAAIVGALADGASGVPERAGGVREGLVARLPSVRVTLLDTRGQTSAVAGVVGRFAAAHPSTKLLIATMDDATALATKAVLESAGRLSDAAIVSHGADRSVHGGMSDRKEIDPSNRGSIVIGSVAFFLDRLGYEVLPLALRVLRGDTVPERTVLPHRLITAGNVFVEYPPYDMQ